MKPTEEQKHIIELIKENKNIVVRAGAGTGKSSTIKMIAKEYPNVSFVGIYFSKTNAEELNKSKSKPKNLIGTTLHSIAYKAIMNDIYKDKLAGYLDYNDIDENQLKVLFNKTNKPQKSYYYFKIEITKNILNIIKEFCMSDLYDIKQFALNVLLNKTIEDIKKTSTLEFAIGNLKGMVYDEYKDLIDIISKHWNYLISDSIAKITHDVYLKMFHLQKRQIDKIWDTKNKQYKKIDIICLDESQDSNPVTLGILANQTIQKLAIGDDSQSIYVWRGAIGSLDNFKDWVQSKLSVSFRFNQYIADLANMVLEKRGDDFRLTGKGISNSNDIVTLCRTNITMWTKAFSRANNGLFSYVEADFEALKTDLFYIHAIKSEIKPNTISKKFEQYKTKKDLEEACEIHDELNYTIKLLETIKTLSGGIEGGLDRLKQFLVKQKQDNVMNFSTIHKSKGLEWDSVIIADDFIPYIKDDNKEKLLNEMWLDREKTSLLYVAITRAKSKVEFPDYLQEFFIK